MKRELLLLSGILQLKPGNWRMDNEMKVESRVAGRAELVGSQTFKKQQSKSFSQASMTWFCCSYSGMISFHLGCLERFLFTSRDEDFKIVKPICIWGRFLQCFVMFLPLSLHSNHICISFFITTFFSEIESFLSKSLHRQLLLLEFTSEINSLMEILHDCHKVVRVQALPFAESRI